MIAFSTKQFHFKFHEALKKLSDDVKLKQDAIQPIPDFTGLRNKSWGFACSYFFKSCCYFILMNCFLYNFEKKT